MLDPVALAPELDAAVLVGWDVAAERLRFDGHPTTVYTRARDERVEAVRAVLAATADPQSPGDVTVSKPSDVLLARRAAGATLDALLLGLGAVALLVGGVGVANTMVISVLERRCEIGLRRALGASRGQIRGQFLAESLLLSLLGGLGGVLLGVAVTAGYAAVQGWPPPCRSARWRASIRRSGPRDCHRSRPWPYREGMVDVDVVIVGAGLSGIGAAYYLQRDHPGRSYAILEARGASGGTWDLFRYPGVRSDSDLHTFGYDFRPWRDERAIAGGDAILEYLRETAAAYGIDGRVRYHHRVVEASWSSAEACWRLGVERADTGERTSVTCRWLFCAGGYYRYDSGYTPDFPGRSRFAGPVVHPQDWPADLDVAGKRVVVIGSGATAVTLVPALAETAGHVTMLQRTPTYILAMPSRDPLARRLRSILREDRAHALVRRINIGRQRAVWRFCRRFPAAARRVIRRFNAAQLPPRYPVDEHFSPPYSPWDQRLCLAPDGDLFRAIRAGTASVVTDRIATFTETGIALESGEDLPADVIVTATGLNVQALGGVALSVDGVAVDVPSAVAYKGVLLSGVPNLAYAIGYTNSSWTLKIGLVCEYWCRLLAHMDAHGYAVCRPAPADPAMATRPLLDFAAGYVRRAVGELPRQGDREPWRTSMTYQADVRLLRRGPIADPQLHFTGSV